MVIDQDAREAAQLFAQALVGVIVVVKVDVDLAEPHAADFHEWVEVLALVFLFRVEEGVNRPAPIGVAKPGAKFGVFVSPTGDTGTFDLITGLPIARLEVVDEAEHQVPRLAIRRLALPVVSKVAAQPQQDMLALHFPRNNHHDK